MYELKASQILYLRMRAQKLTPSDRLNPINPAELLAQICCIQAQYLPAANLAFQPRSRDMAIEDVDRARIQDGSIVRTWCMRGTIHLLPARDLGWLLSIFGPIFVQKSRRRYRELGLDDHFCEAAIAVLPDILYGQKSMTRQQLAAALLDKGFPTTGQATYHLLRRAALEGVICFGPDQDGQPAFVLLNEWAPQSEALSDREAALARLARRYLAAYGPARVEDLATWSGLSIKDSRTGLAQKRDELLEIQGSGSEYWLLNSQAHWLDEVGISPIVRLLPAFDTYLLGYRGRDLSVPEQYARRVHPGGGMLRATVIIDGIAAATWRRKRMKEGLIIEVEPFTGLSPASLAGIEAEVRDLGRYQGISTRLVITGNPD